MKLMITSFLLFVASFGFAQTQKCEFTFPTNIKNVNGLYPVEILSSCSVRKVEVVVMNRWGNEIYKTNNLKHDWQGKDTADGVYYISVTGEYYGSGEKFSAAGFVNFFN